MIALTTSSRGQRWSSLFVTLLSALVLVLIAAVTSVVALAVNEASSGEKRWPWGLHVIQDYPFPALLVLTILFAALSVMAMSVKRAPTATPPP
ncbi:hypothetical protein GCM10027614_76260 [Micromonospora vulcania]